MNTMPNITKNLIEYAHDLRRKADRYTSKDLEDAIKGLETGEFTDAKFTLLMGLIRFAEINIYQDSQIERLNKEISRLVA